MDSEEPERFQHLVAGSPLAVNDVLPLALGVIQPESLVSYLDDRITNVPKDGYVDIKTLLDWQRKTVKHREEYQYLAASCSGKYFHSTVSMLWRRE